FGDLIPAKSIERSATLAPPTRAPPSSASRLEPQRPAWRRWRARHACRPGRRSRSARRHGPHLRPRTRADVRWPRSGIGHEPSASVALDAGETAGQLGDARLTDGDDREIARMRLASLHGDPGERAIAIALEARRHRAFHEDHAGEPRLLELV